MDWQFANRMTHMKRSSIREILKVTTQPDMISFAGGLPAPEYFPVEEIRRASDYVFSQYGEAACQYSTTEGYEPLRQFIAERLSDENLHISADDILIVSGSQQGLDLVGRILLDEGSTVITEDPTYLGAITAWRPLGLDYRAVSGDRDGLQVEEIEGMLEEGTIPRLVYIVPDFQNPTGTTLSRERRQRLVELASQYGFPIMEDNPYGELRFEGETLPSLMHLDALHTGLDELNGHVIYSGTFSKILAPGMRIGWIAAPPDVRERLIQAKQSVDLHTNITTQMIIHEVVKDGFLNEHIPTLRSVYSERRNLMIDTLNEFFPAGVSWTEPQGGLFLMIYLPEHMDAMELFERAIGRKVAFVPGADFHLGNGGHNTMRLNFSNAAPDRIVEGMRRLGDLLKEELVGVTA